MIGPARKKPFVTTSPAPSRRFEEESSPTKASILLRSDSSEYISGLKAKKENYSTAISLYTACYEHELPQKCLKHLNFVTLYCADEHRLLCVNCLYGSTAHKNHSVTPSNSSQIEIKKDNELSIRSLDDMMKEVKESEVKVIENRRLIESENSLILQEITKDFSEMRKMLDTKERQLKQRVARQFQRAAQQNETTIREVQWWRNETQKIRSSLPREGVSEQAEIYKHLVLELMLNEKLENQKLTYIASKDQMEHEFLSETRELKDTIKSRLEEGNRSHQVRLF